jgi:hypothetical protein
MSAVAFGVLELRVHLIGDFYNGYVFADGDD